MNTQVFIRLLRIAVIHILKYSPCDWDKNRTIIVTAITITNVNMVNTFLQNWLTAIVLVIFFNNSLKTAKGYQINS